MPSCQKIDELVRFVLFEDEELGENKIPKNPEDVILVESITGRGFGFHKGRLEEVKKDIEEQLSELPDRFKEGVSFLELCMDKDGKQWGEHRYMDLLLLLGTAIGKVECCAPRDMWDLLPGGMPYFRLLDN